MTSMTGDLMDSLTTISWPFLMNQSNNNNIQQSMSTETLHIPLSGYLGKAGPEADDGDGKGFEMMPLEVPPPPAIVGR